MGFKVFMCLQCSDRRREMDVLHVSQRQRGAVEKASAL